MSLSVRSVLAAILGLWIAGLNGWAAGMPDANDPVAGMGINIHFTDAQPGELEMLARAGFHWVRMDFSWAATEKTPGTYDFSAYERLLDPLDGFHIRAILILDYGNPLYDGGLSPHTEAGRAAFARWAAAAAVHFQNRGVLWEIWNEPNGSSFWKPKPNADDYARLALTANQAIHQAARNELIVGPALSSSNLALVEVAAKAGVLAGWSGITIHPYFRHGPESYGPAYENTRRLIQHYGQGREIAVLCGESGYSTVWRGMDDTKQGQYLARLFLFDVLSGVPVTIWYDWHDDGLDAKNPEHHFGIVHYDYHAGTAEVYEPKPAYEAALTYSHELAGLQFRARLPLTSTNDFALSFTHGAGECLVAWTTAHTPHAADVPAEAGVYSVLDYDGKPETDVTAANNGITLLLDGGPKYLQRH